MRDRSLLFAVLLLAVGMGAYYAGRKSVPAPQSVREIRPTTPPGKDRGTGAYYALDNLYQQVTGDRVLHHRRIAILSSRDPNRPSTFTIEHNYRAGHRSVGFQINGYLPTDFSPDPYYEIFKNAHGDDDRAMEQVVAELANLRIGDEEGQAQYQTSLDGK